MSQIQSIVFLKKYRWNIKNARSWLKSHKIKPLKRVHELQNEL